MTFKTWVEKRKTKGAYSHSLIPSPHLHPSIVHGIKKKVKRSLFPLSNPFTSLSPKRCPSLQLFFLFLALQVHYETDTDTTFPTPTSMIVNTKTRSNERAFVFLTKPCRKAIDSLHNTMCKMNPRNSSMALISTGLKHQPSPSRTISIVECSTKPN